MSRSPSHRSDGWPVRLAGPARLAAAGLLLAWLLAGAGGSALAASPEPSAGADYGGDTRTSGSGPGLVGSPLYALGGVLAVALVSIGITLVYVRLTASPALEPQAGSVAGPDDSEAG